MKRVIQTVLLGALAASLGMGVGAGCKKKPKGDDPGKGAETMVPTMQQMRPVADQRAPAMRPPTRPTDHRAAPRPGERRAHGKVHWGYAGKHGPAHWGDLAPAFALCKTGKKQSPVDLKGAKPGKVDALSFAYKPAPLRVDNNGHALQWNQVPQSKLKVGKDEYTLLQIHFHSPSEHTVDGKAFPLEAHFVHKSAAGKLAVVGVLYTVKAENKALATLWKKIPTEPHSNAVHKGTLDPTLLLPKNRSSFRYPGSLTTPPCSEGVRWIVLRTPMTISAKQLASFNTAYKGNLRPVLPLNDRTILLGK